MKIKKYIAMFLILAVALSMVACKGAEDKESAETSTAAPESTVQAEKALNEYEDVMKLKVAYFNGTAQPPDPVNNLTVKYIRDTVKIDLSESIFLGGEDPYQKMSLMVASQEMPDVIVGWRVPQLTELINQFADAGMLLETEPYFKYIPNITKHYTDATLDVVRNPKDSKLYEVPSWCVNPDLKDYKYTIEPNLSLVIRRDLVDQNGLKIPKTMDEFYNLLKTFKTLPDVKGQKIIPLQNFNWDDFELLIGGGFDIWKHRMDLNDAEKRTVSMYETSDYIEFLKYAAKLYREGLIDPEIFTSSYQIAYERMGAGRTGVCVDWPNNIDTNTGALQKNVPNGMLEAMSVPSVDGNGHTEYWQVATLGACDTIISKNVSDPARIMKFFDWQFTQEGWATVAMGAPSKEEGSWYIEDGKAYYNKDVYDAKVAADPAYATKIGGWVYMTVGQFQYKPEDIGLICEKISDAQRVYAAEQNMDDVWMNQEYERWQAIAPGPVKTEKNTAVTQLIKSAVSEIVMKAKSDEEVVAMHKKMMEKAIAAGLTAVQQEEYASIKALK